MRSERMCGRASPVRRLGPRIEDTRRRRCGALPRGEVGLSEMKSFTEQKNRLIVNLLEILF